MVDYDVIIIGSGPAGMNACLYASRSNLKTLVIEKNYPGGKVVKINKIENWIGNQMIEGADLALQMFKHAFSKGGEYEQNNVLDIVDYGEYKEIIFKDKKYKCYAVIVCTGTIERKIGIPGEEKFYGKGVSYCAVCDGALYKGKNMVVIGDSDYAIEETIYLSQFAKKIIFINSDDKLNEDSNIQKELKENNVIEIKNNHKMVSINGDESVTSVTVKDNNGNEDEIKTDVVFPLVGNAPDSMFLLKLGITNENNYIEVNDKQETKIKGVYAAGDCTNRSLKQIITACSDGAIAAIEAYKYITGLKRKLKE